jgi:ribosomal protein S18 acetylase RimI-like enzyme
LLNLNHSSLSRLATLEDKFQLSQIAQDAYSFSRYFFDQNFNPDKCQAFYVEWVHKSITGHLDDYVLVQEVDGVIAGYVTVKLSRNLATIGLVGVRDEFRGTGIGRRLMQDLELFLFEFDVPLVRVVTQGRNIAAQNLYSSCGYGLVNNEYWLHRWDTESQMV